MKTLIIYGSRRGCTRFCAEELAKYTDGDFIDARNRKNINLKDYDTVIIGSSIWRGKVTRHINSFVNNNLSGLLKKKIGIFICAGDDVTNHAEKNFPAELLAHAHIREHFGGKLDLDSFSPLMRYILRKKAGVKASYNRLKPGVIQAFGKAFSN